MVTRQVKQVKPDYILRLKECIGEIDNWMSSNRLCLNADKTQFIWLGTKQQLAKVQFQTVNIGTASLPVATEVTCLEVVFDSELTFSKHVKSVVSRCFYHLRQLRTVRKSLTTKSLKVGFHYPSSRPEFTDARVHGRPVSTTRVDGPS